MPFAPHEIENKRFVTALRGYQTDEVDAFLRAVAADYRALVVEANSSLPGHLVADLERIVGSTRQAAEREAAELRGAAAEEAAALRDAAEREAAELRSAAAEETAAVRDAAEREAAELRSAAAGDAAAVREAAVREAAEVKAATQSEAEACFAEIARQAEELHRLETSLWVQLHALEHAIAESKQTLSHARNLYPAEATANDHGNLVGLPSGL